MIKYEKVLSLQNAIRHQVTAPIALRAVPMSAEIQWHYHHGQSLVEWLAGLLYSLQKALESRSAASSAFWQIPVLQTTFTPYGLQAHLQGFAQIMDCRFLSYHTLCTKGTKAKLSRRWQFCLWLPWGRVVALRWHALTSHNLRSSPSW